jgi:hypothetical protein
MEAAAAVAAAVAADEEAAARKAAKKAAKKSVRKAAPRAEGGGEGVAEGGEPASSAERAPLSELGAQPRFATPQADWRLARILAQGSDRPYFSTPPLSPF